MRVLTDTPVAIISGELATLGSEENSKRTASLHVDLLKTFGVKNVKVVRGSYKGTEETAFVVNGGRKELIEIATIYEQESILALDTARNAVLHFIDKHHPEANAFGGKPIGRFQAVEKDEALAADGFTYDKGQDTYYIVK